MDSWNRTIKTYSRMDIIKYAVNNYAWQTLRLSMKGKSTKVKLDTLSRWLQDNDFSHEANVQVDNYLGALKRGGQISAKGDVVK